MTEETSRRLLDRMSDAELNALIMHTLADVAPALADQYRATDAAGRVAILQERLGRMAS
jgi:hypothetical protein